MLNSEIPTLPWPTVLFLASGYAGYFISNTGLKDHHKQIEIAFSCAVFGFFGLLAYYGIGRFEFSVTTASMGAFVLTTLVGAFWRVLGRPALQGVLRLTRVSHANDVPSAWLSLLGVTNANATQLAVYLKDGTVLQCADLHRFARSINGPCVLGSSGDVLMYVTDVRKSGKKSDPNTHVEHEGWGQEVTYIPASEIARIEFRRITTS